MVEMGLSGGAPVDPLEAARRALRAGRIVLLYDADGREEETDMVVAGAHVTPDIVRRMRHDAGGLLCTALAPEHHEALGLPFLSDLVQEAAAQHPALAGLLPDDIRYDGQKPAFGLTLNHRATYTGITDEDRSRTITALAALAGETSRLGPAAARRRLAAEFRSPGHVFLLNGAPGGLAARQGHTELSLELARQSGLPGCTTVCEMLDPDGGQALSKAKAQAYAQAHGLVFLTGEEVVAAWRKALPPTPATPGPVPTSA